MIIVPSLISENAGYLIILLAILTFIFPFFIPLFVNVGNTAGTGGVVDTGNWYVQLVAGTILLSGFLFFIGIIPFFKDARKVICPECKREILVPDDRKEEKCLCGKRFQI